MADADESFLERCLERYCDLSRRFIRNPPVVDVERYFPESRVLRREWRTIRDEILGVVENKDVRLPEFHHWEEGSTDISTRDPRSPWHTLPLKVYGHWLAKNCALVPATTRLLRSLPNVALAMFSILSGEKHIPRHTGYFKGVFRYHLALEIPEDDPPFLILGDRRIFWKEGEDILFDDTFPHEVHNPSARRRILLFIDVHRDRRSLPWAFHIANKALYRVVTRSSFLLGKLPRAAILRGGETL